MQSCAGFGLRMARKTKAFGSLPGNLTRCGSIWARCLVKGCGHPRASQATGTRSRAPPDPVSGGATTYQRFANSHRIDLPDKAMASLCCPKAAGVVWLGLAGRPKRRRQGGEASAIRASAVTAPSLSSSGDGMCFCSGKRSAPRRVDQTAEMIVMFEGHDNVETSPGTITAIS
jgi:hypothetical protein